MRPPILLCVGALFVNSVGLNIAQAQVSERPVVIAQRFDDDCGLAALRMLLQRSGFDLSEIEIASGLDSTRSLDALSAADLVSMIENLGLGLRLDVSFLPVDAIARFAEFEPFLILLNPQPISGNAVFNHFVLVERRTENGYIIADPILGARVELSDRDLAERTHGREVSDVLNPMVLRLSRSGQGSGEILLSSGSDLRLMDWEAAYRQPRLLPLGKTQLSFGYAVQAERFRPENGVVLGELNREFILGFTHGLTSRSQVGLSLSFTDGSGSIEVDGNRFSFGLNDVRAATLSFRHVPNIALPSGLGLVTSADLNWLDEPQSSYGTLGADLSYVHNDLAFGLGAEVQYDGEAYWQVTPSAAYSTAIANYLLLDLSVAVPFDVTFGTSSYETQVALSRSFGPDFLVRGFVGYSVTGDGTSDQVGAGIEFVYGIPRRFRNSE